MSAKGTTVVRIYDDDARSLRLLAAAMGKGSFPRDVVARAIQALIKADPQARELLSIEERGKVSERDKDNRT